MEAGRVVYESAFAGIPAADIRRTPDAAQFRSASTGMPDSIQTPQTSPRIEA